MCPSPRPRIGLGRVTERTGEPDTNGLPRELKELLGAEDAAVRERAWRAFVERYNRILLHSVHSHADGYDDAMDRYAFVLEELHKGDFARLKRFSGDGRSRLSTWLVVVVRRLCDDYHRQRYGRLRAGDGREGRRATERHDLRRRLVDMAASELNIALVPDGPSQNPELALRRRELEEALGAAVDALDSQEQLMIKLRFYEGMAAREISDLMKLPSRFHVRRRIRSALATVRERLEAAGVADSRP